MKDPRFAYDPEEEGRLQSQLCSVGRTNPHW